LPPEAALVWGKQTVLETPHIDSLAKDGAVCNRFYAASPVCTPSRASFVSGRYPQNTGAPSNDKPMRDEIVTFGEVLQRNGYSTGYAGKWHLDGPSKPGFGPSRKFGFADNRYMFNRGHWKQLEDTPQGPAVKARQGDQPSYSVAGANAQSFTTDFLADKTVEFIQQHKDKPFCYMVSLPDPHGPNSVRPPYDSMFSHLKFERPATATQKGQDLPGWAQPPSSPAMEAMDRYFGMVKCIDDNVGKIIAALRASAVWDHTIVVFTSDHGDLCGEHGRVNKGSPLETSARVPFIIRYPGKIKPGTVIHEAFSTADFKPTILGMMGFQSTGKDEGRDGSGIFVTGKAPAGWKNVAFSHQSSGNWLMAVSSRYKLVFSVSDNPCLFDLETDPLEMRNLFASAERRDTVRELALALLDYSQRFGEPAINDTALKSDLEWAAKGDGVYVAPKRGKSAASNDEADDDAPRAKGKKGKAKKSR
jgi:arylsulfatase A-like enzyme